MDFFNQVLDQSLIPVLIYSFPYVHYSYSTSRAPRCITSAYSMFIRNPKRLTSSAF
jgi:hypothetical protein